MTAKESRTLQGTLIRIGQGLLVLIVATTFSLLALWQWDRAEGHQELEAEMNRIATSAPASYGYGEEKKPAAVTAGAGGRTYVSRSFAI